MQGTTRRVAFFRACPPIQQHATSVGKRATRDGTETNPHVFREARDTRASADPHRRRPRVRPDRPARDARSPRSPEAARRSFSSRSLQPPRQNRNKRADTPRSAFRRGATFWFPSSPVARFGRGTMTQSLGELEQLCNVMYNSHNPNERAHAEGVLRPFSSNPEYIPQCKVRRDAWLFFARAHPFNNTRRRSARGRRGTGPRRTRTCFAKLETRARAPIRTGVDRASAQTARLETRARLDPPRLRGEASPRVRFSLLDKIETNALTRL